MEKKYVSRDNFKSSLLKQVIMRIDYSEITNFEGLIQERSSFLKQYFTTRGKYQTNNINPTISEKDLAQERVPIAILPQNEVYRFTMCKIEPRQNVVLDMANTFVCLIIKCDDNYDKIDEYINLLSGVMNNVLEFDSYITIQRVGIRKIDGKSFDSLEHAKNVFENIEQVDYPLLTMNVYQSRVISFMIDKKSDIQINLSRKYNKTDDQKYQVELDIDGYVGVAKLTDVDEQNGVMNILKNINNLLFENFKINVTESFLNNGLIK